MTRTSISLLAIVLAAHAATAREAAKAPVPAHQQAPLRQVDDPAWTARIVLHRPAARIETGSLGSRAPAMPPATRLIGPHHHALDGIASYYWQEQMTASGERFNRRAMTAAHKTLPLGTRVRVTRVDSGRSVDVRINDRGPFKPGRVIDLSEAAAEVIDMKSAGLTRVKVVVLGP